MRSDIAEMRVGELCALRGQINERLAQIAATTHAELAKVEDWRRPYGPGSNSETIVSYDGCDVRVAFFELRPDTDCVSRVKGGRERFDPLPGDTSTFPSGRWYGSTITVPLSVYEAGPSVIRSLWAVEEAQRVADSEKYEREQYEKLQAKYGAPQTTEGT